MSSSTMPPPQPPPKGPSLPPVSEQKQEEEEAKRVEEDVKRAEVKPVEERLKQVDRDWKQEDAQPDERDVNRVEAEGKRADEEPKRIEERTREDEAAVEKTPSKSLHDSGLAHAKESRAQQESSGIVTEKGTSSDHGSIPRDRTSTRPHSRVPSGATTILLDAPLPSLPRDDRNEGVHDLRRARTSRGTNSTLYSNRPLPPSRQPSGIDWIVPVDIDEKVLCFICQLEITTNASISNKRAHTRDRDES